MKLNLEKILKNATALLTNYLEPQEKLVYMNLPNSTHKGYILVINEIKGLGNSATRFSILGHILKSKDLIDLNDIGNFAFFGDAIRCNNTNSYIKFEKSVELLEKVGGTDKGVFMKCNFMGEIEIDIDTEQKNTVKTASINLEEEV